ncbi:hypothetical protein [Microbulbifer celer]|uniref:Uncharacterized protein n=1 Tax=Microbulbifer celer TaxID=435905 RepID=A0ABW3UFT3_9GAMM|nr:hypothetical protein [Microbulbifer celer]UFN55988.1 hypothetical protein LPW13_10395 [Microbulbifer celer]
MDLLGVSIHLHELRTAGDSGDDGELRNIEFFIREGIRPQRLFDDNSQVVTGYWPLYHNNVGYGAVTQRILYQFVERDSNGDGQLSTADRSTLAVSLPDGSNYRQLGGATGEVLDMTYLSERGELLVDMLDGDQVVQRMYVLAEMTSQ